MIFRRNNSHAADVQAFRAAGAANGAYDPSWESGIDAPRATREAVWDRELRYQIDQLKTENAALQRRIDELTTEKDAANMRADSGRMVP